MNTASQKVIPRAYAYLNTLNIKTSFKSISKYAERFGESFDEVLLSLEDLEDFLGKCNGLKESFVLRNKVGKVGERLSKLCGLLEKS